VRFCIDKVSEFALTLPLASQPCFGRAARKGGKRNGETKFGEKIVR
jgi:hypothetical protein